MRGTTTRTRRSGAQVSPLQFYLTQPHAELNSDDAVMADIGYVNFAADWSTARTEQDTPSRVVDDPRCPLDAAQLHYLASVVDPLGPSNDHGIVLYERALRIVRIAGY